MESESNMQPRSLLPGSFNSLSQGKRRLTATEIRQIQKLKRESSFESDPFLNQRVNITEFSMPAIEEDPFHGEHNTSSNRELQKAGPSHVFQTPFPNLEESEFREVHATSSNSNSMMNFFSNLQDEFPNKQAIPSRLKKEDSARETYKWTSDDLSLKTSVTLFSTRPFDDIFDTASHIRMPSFSRNSLSNSTNDYNALPAQYKFVRQAQMTGVGVSDYLNALRSAYTLYKREASRKFYILMRGVTCLFVHKNEKNGKDDKAFSSMVLVASERKSFQQTLTKNEIDFEIFNARKGSEEAELEKLPIFESQTAFTNKFFDLVDNVDVYIIKKKQVQAFFNVVLNEIDSEAQLEIIAEYPFSNSGIFHPKITYNGPIRLNELSEVNAQEEMLEESVEQQALKNYKIFEEERALKVLYKLHVEGCIMPLTLKALLDTIEARQTLLKINTAPHFITEKFDGKILGQEPTN